MGPKPEGAIFYNADHKLLQYCDGASWVAMHPSGSGAGGCNTATMGIKREGYIFYNADHRVMQVCAGAVWRPLGPVGGISPVGPTGCSNIGDICSDGSVYAGLSPDGNVKMYTTPADAGGILWNNGNSSGYVTTNQTNATTGETNTGNLITIDSDSGTGGTQPHQAAQYCADLSAHSQTDWYLPARNELNVLYTNRVAIGGFNTSGSGYYWSSSEDATNAAWYQRFSDGTQFVDVKDGVAAVRCVRKATGTGPCTDPARPEGALVFNSAYHAYQYCDGANWVPIGKLIDREPDAFGFTDQSDVALSTLVESNIVAIAGITTAPVSISGDGSPQYRICNDAACTQVDHDWSSGGGWIDDGQHLQLRLTSNASGSVTNSATITVGTADDQWDVTTEASSSFPQILSTAVSNSGFEGSSTHTVNLPSGIQSGDVIVIIFGAYGTHNTPTGYTLIHNDEISDWWGVNGSVFAKFASGSEGATVNVTTSDSDDVSLAVAYRIANASAFPEAASATGRSINPDPPSLSPSFGSQETLWLAASLNGADPGALATPTGYQNMVSERNPGHFSLYSMEKQVETATENPGTYTIEEVLGGDPYDWIAFTIAVY